MASKKITINSTVVASKNQVSSRLGEEAAILNWRAGMYYGVDAVGARVWELLEKPRRVKEICDTLVSEYDVAPERCQKDLLELLAELATEDLIEIGD